MNTDIFVSTCIHSTSYYYNTKGCRYVYHNKRLLICPYSPLEYLSDFHTAYSNHISCAPMILHYNPLPAPFVNVVPYVPGTQTPFLQKFNIDFNTPAKLSIKFIQKNHEFNYYFYPFNGKCSELNIETLITDCRAVFENEQIVFIIEPHLFELYDILDTISPNIKFAVGVTGGGYVGSVKTVCPSNDSIISFRQKDVSFGVTSNSATSPKVGSIVTVVEDIVKILPSKQRAPDKIYPTMPMQAHVTMLEKVYNQMFEMFKIKNAAFEKDYSDEKFVFDRYVHDLNFDVKKELEKGFSLPPSDEPVEQSGQFEQPKVSTQKSTSESDDSSSSSSHNTSELGSLKSFNTIKPVKPIVKSEIKEIPSTKQTRKQKNKKSAKKMSLSYVNPSEEEAKKQYVNEFITSSLNVEGTINQHVQQRMVTRQQVTEDADEIIATMMTSPEDCFENPTPLQIDLISKLLDGGQLSINQLNQLSKLKPIRIDAKPYQFISLNVQYKGKLPEYSHQLALLSSFAKVDLCQMYKVPPKDLDVAVPKFVYFDDGEKIHWIINKSGETNYKCSHGFYKIHGYTIPEDVESYTVPHSSFYNTIINIIKNVKVFRIRLLNLQNPYAQSLIELFKKVVKGFHFVTSHIIHMCSKYDVEKGDFEKFCKSTMEYNSKSKSWIYVYKKDKEVVYFKKEKNKISRVEKSEVYTTTPNSSLIRILFVAACLLKTTYAMDVEGIANYVGNKVLVSCLIFSIVVAIINVKIIWKVLSRFVFLLMSLVHNVLLYTKIYHLAKQYQVKINRVGNFFLEPGKWVVVKTEKLVVYCAERFINYNFSNIPTGTLFTFALVICLPFVSALHVTPGQVVNYNNHQFEFISAIPYFKQISTTHFDDIELLYHEQYNCLGTAQCDYSCPEDVDAFHNHCILLNWEWPTCFLAKMCKHVRYYAQHVEYSYPLMQYQGFEITVRLDDSIDTKVVFEQTQSFLNDTIFINLAQILNPLDSYFSSEEGNFTRSNILKKNNYVCKGQLCELKRIPVSMPRLTGINVVINQNITFTNPAECRLESCAFFKNEKAFLSCIISNDVCKIYVMKSGQNVTSFDYIKGTNRTISIYSSEYTLCSTNCIEFVKTERIGNYTLSFGKIKMLDSVSTSGIAWWFWFVLIVVILCILLIVFIIFKCRSVFTTGSHQKEY